MTRRWPNYRMQRLAMTLSCRARPVARPRRGRRGPWHSGAAVLHPVQLSSFAARQAVASGPVTSPLMRPRMAWPHQRASHVPSATPRSVSRCCITLMAPLVARHERSVRDFHCASVTATTYDIRDEDKPPKGSGLMGGGPSVGSRKSRRDAHAPPSRWLMANVQGLRVDARWLGMV